MVKSVGSGSQLEMSYRGWLRGSDLRESEIAVVLHGIVTILRRHSIHGTLCSDCGNDDADQVRVKDVDKMGFITAVECLVCGKHLSATCRKSKFYFERIADPAVLVRGDHIGFHRPFGYWHHGIVTRQGADRIAVVGYSISDDGSPCAKVIEKEYEHRCMSGMVSGSLYRFSHNDCYTNDYTALRAEKIIGEEKYDFFEQNCEHSVVWCKTGLHSSDQLESCFTSLGKIALTTILRAAVLSVLWLLQLCHLASDDGADGLWTERGVNITYVTLVIVVFSSFSIYKHVGRIKSSAVRSHHEPEDDWMESCRKNCTDGFFRCCCRAEPACSRLTCFVCFLSCFVCSLCQASCSMCAEKLRMCCMPCCGRPPSAIVALVVRVLIRELIAASGAFLIVWFVDDVVSFFEGRNVIISGSPFANRAIIVILAILIVSIVAYPVGVVLSRWAQGMIECCCCDCPDEHKHRDKCVKPPFPVHDEIMHIPDSFTNDQMMTGITITQSSDNPCSAVIIL